MSQFALTVSSLFDGHSIVSNKTIHVENGFIKAIENSKTSTKLDYSGTLVAGFIDIQVNGGGGVLFNQSPDLSTIKQIAKAHQAFGTTGWLPTLITDSLDKMQQAADAVASAHSQSIAGVLGIHFEGPHLSAAKKGIHPEQYIRQLSAAEEALYCRKDLGKILLTLAPETVAPEVISRLVDLGVTVCLGHSNANYQQAQSALLAGATGFTHLFNAMSAFTSREPGMVGAALMDQNCYYGLILDGEHVHPASAKLALSNNSNMILVTDAMPLVGVEQKQFQFFGKTIDRKNNRLTDSEGRLAGSVLDMKTAVNNCVQMLGISQIQALNMASKLPAKFLGLDQQYGTLAVGKKASMVVLDEQGDIVANWVDGQQVI
ncbi:MAG: N-acetylglucosamine-6-phosphate deacetylase [Gammaproteobacteria bacterium]|nr:MAG: N-acetylglucosamine-6-phosphate deacetylase [Gammaproteobacteria bacterium]